MPGHIIIKFQNTEGKKAHQFPEKQNHSHERHQLLKLLLLAKDS